MYVTYTPSAIASNIIVTIDYIITAVCAISTGRDFPLYDR